MAGWPTGTVTFLFTDIEGSTRLWEAAPGSMSAALECHDDIVRSAVERHGGRVFATGGDGFAVVFERAAEAASAAVAAQQGLSSTRWPDGVEVRVRMALHSGDAVERGGDYFGPNVNRAARLMAVGHGGQVLCSKATAGLIEGKFTLVDLGEHRLRDLGLPQRIFQLGDGAFPPLRSPDVVPTNLPVTLTELVGRDDEISELVPLVEAERLVTLTGVGGVGKTRLALSVAAEAAGSFPDGCWLVDLSAVSGPEDVLRAVASTLGVAVGDQAGLARYLGDRRVLMVMDNCEHVLDTVAELVECLLATGRDPAVLATSREPLGVPGEVVRRVRSLGVPEGEAEFQEALRSEAVRLFVERAVAHGGFALDAINVAAVVEICRRLDGIPLAIELAAAQAAAMPSAEIARRLDERFRMLRSGARRVQERHRTLQNAVSWSHDLLAAHERIVFRRLAVFPATFDLRGAEAVTGHDADVLSCLVRLVNSSMVGFEPVSGRYSLLETLRQYAAERLADTGETDAAYERHARHYLARAVESGAALADPQRWAGAHVEVAPETENIRAAAAWFKDQELWAELFTICEVLWTFWVDRAPAEWYPLYRHAVEHNPALLDRERADALGRVALAAYWANDIDAVEALAASAQSVADGAGAADVGSWGWLARALARPWHGDVAGAAEAARRAVDIAERGGHEAEAALASAALADFLRQLGQEDDARDIAAEALRRGRAAGDRFLLQSTLVALASYYTLTDGRDDNERALALLDDLAELGPLDPLQDAWAEIGRGRALLDATPSAAIPHLIRATELADRHHIVQPFNVALRLLAPAAAKAGRLQEAAMLAAWVEERLSPGQRPLHYEQWAETELHSALAPLPDERRALYAEAGTRLTRREMLTLVASLQDRTTIS